MWVVIAAVLFVIFIAVLYVLSPVIAPKPIQVEDAHVMITGGSSGIGRAIAVEFVKQGASVTILARNATKLAEAKILIEKNVKNSEKQKVVCVAVDVAKDYSAVLKAVKQVEENVGPVDILVNSAGTSLSGRFEDIPIDDFKKLMNINYIGSVYATRAVIEGMKQREKGRVVFISSQGGQLGLFGYSAYAASKFALRGLAESLQMEVKPYNIRICLAFPPDTDTPGYAEEMTTKPKETKLISETAGLFQADYVARKVIKDTVHGKFSCFIGVDGYMLSCLTCGMSPIISLMEATQQVWSMGLFRIISLFYLDSFDRLILKCKQERDEASAKKTD